MPTISQLPAATAVDPADQVPLSQGGTTRSVSVGEMLATMQPAIMAPTGALLGRVSVGAGGPEPITVGTGLALSASSLQANGADHSLFPQKASLQTTDQAVLSSNGSPALLPLAALRGLFSAGTNVSIDANGVISASGSGAGGGPVSIAALSQVSALAPTDLVGVSQGGSNHAITYANLIDGKTIDQGTPAGPAADTDTFWVGQGGSTMLAQSFGAMWTWVSGHLPGYRQPVVEITTNTTLDGSAHNGHILVVSKPVTLTHSSTQGSGFACSVVNVSGGNVTFDNGMDTTAGVQTLSSGQCAMVYSITYSGGTVNVAWLSGSAGPSVPSQVLGVIIGTVTSSSIALSWSIPTGGGAPSGYVVQYRPTGESAWATQTAALSSAVLAGLPAATEFDIEVIAQNATGFGPASVIVNAATASAPTMAPGAPTGLAAAAPSASSLTLSWSAPASGGAVASYTVQYRLTGQTAWGNLAAGIIATSTTATGLASSTQYDFQVLAVNGAGASVPSPVATGTTLIAAPGVPSGLAASGVTQTGGQLSWTVPSSGGAVATYTVQYALSGTGAWTQVTGVAGTTYVLSSLLPGTAYDVQVAAVNAGGSSSFTPTVSFTTMIAMPGVPPSVTIGAGTSTSLPVSWSAPSSGGAVATYSVRYSVHAANVWTTVTGLTTTTATLAGLTSSTSYDVEVQAINAGGAGAWTAAVTGTTSAPSNYLLTPFAPVAGYSAAHGTNGIVAQVNDNSAAGDGSHTMPHAVNIAWSTSSTVQPTSGMQSTVQYSNAGHNLWVTYANGPTVAGTWYLWGIAYDASGNIVASCVSPGFVFT